MENPSIHPGALEFLESLDWPGNVRELENVIRKVLLLARGYTISADHIRATVTRAPTADAASDQTLGAYVDKLLSAAQRGGLQDARTRLLDTAERELFRRAISLAHGNQAKAARWLGVSRITMKAKLVQFGLHPGQGPEAG